MSHYHSVVWIDHQKASAWQFKETDAAAIEARGLRKRSRRVVDSDFLDSVAATYTKHEASASDNDLSMAKSVAAKPRRKRTSVFPCQPWISLVTIPMSVSLSI